MHLMSPAQILVLEALYVGCCFNVYACHFIILFLWKNLLDTLMAKLGQNSNFIYTVEEILERIITLLFLICSQLCTRNNTKCFES